MNYKYISKKKEVYIKRRMNDFFKKARKMSKQEECFYCGKKENKFCKSHSIPKFILKNIESKEGKILNNNSILEVPAVKDINGTKEAGTFSLICRDCDSKIFADYENSSFEKEELNQKILAQISMKINLKTIYRKINNKNENILLYNEFNYSKAKNNNEVVDMDLLEAIKEFEKAKEINLKLKKEEYHIYYYKELEYVVPIAFQNSVALYLDLDDSIINDIYYYDKDYEIKNMYICIFPLKEKSILFMYVDDDSKRYRPFFRKFNKMSEEKQLELINYIIFLYSENIFISPDIKRTLLQDYKLKKASRTSKFDNYIGIVPLKMLKEEYTLSNSAEIPNFLDKRNRLR